MWSLTACRRRAMSFQLMGELEGADCACTRAHTVNVARDANGAGWYGSGGRAWWRERTLAPHRTVPAIAVNERTRVSFGGSWRRAKKIVGGSKGVSFAKRLLFGGLGEVTGHAGDLEIFVRVVERYRIWNDVVDMKCRAEHDIAYGASPPLD